METSRYVPLFPPAPTKDQNRGKVLVELIEKTKEKEEEEIEIGEMLENCGGREITKRNVQ